MGLSLTKKIHILAPDDFSTGRTTLLYQCVKGEDISATHTSKYNFETLEYKGSKLSMWDVGHEEIERLWSNYVRGTDGVIFVVDSSDPSSMSISHKTLVGYLNDPTLDKVPFLIFANKQDKPGALSVAEVTEKLELANDTHKLRVFGCSAKTGDGIHEGLDWFIDNL